MPIHLDAEDRRLLDRVQSDIPLVPRPYDALARELGLSESEVMERLGRMRIEGTIRRMSAIFDSSRIGHSSVLLAFSTPEDQLESAANVISGHPGVSHLYEREHAIYRLWATLTVPSTSDLRSHAKALERLAGASHMLFLPATRMIKIGVRFSASEETNTSILARDFPKTTPLPLDKTQRAVVRVLQEDLATIPRPFDTPASDCGLSTDGLLAVACEFLASGTMRRFAAVAHHTGLGYRANILAVWNLSDARIEKTIECIAGEPAISHAYLRSAEPEWPYALYTMMHGKTPNDLRPVLDRVREATGTKPLELATVREFKKTRVRYFTGEVERWERENGLHNIPMKK
jgi:DNA-binding Lrp family transcriptional regulator